MGQGAGTVEYVGKIQLDAADFLKGLQGMGKMGMGGGGGGSPTGSGSQEEQAKTIHKGMRKSFKDPSFMSIFRPLAALEGLKGLVQNSRVANAYLGGMGKMFSAAIDLLLLPFTPLLNLMMVGLAKLIAWLIDSGALEWIGEGVEKLIKLFEGFGKWIQKLFTDPGAAFMDAVKWLWERMKDIFKNPLGSAKSVAQIAAAGTGAAILAQMGMGAIGLGGLGPLALGKRGLGALFGRGGGAAAGDAAMMAAGGGGGAGGGGMMARMGLRGGTGFFGMNRGLQGGMMAGGGMLMGNTLGQQGGTMGTMGRMGGMGLTGAGIGMMAGGPMGAAIGGGIGLGIGGASELGIPGATHIAGLLGMGKPQNGGGGGGGGGGGKVTNIGTQNITMNIKVDDPKLVKEMYKQLDEQSTQSAMEG